MFLGKLGALPVRLALVLIPHLKMLRYALSVLRDVC